MKRTNVFLTEEQRERLQGMSEEYGVAFSELIRQAIDLFLEIKDDTDELKRRSAWARGYPAGYLGGPGSSFIGGPRGTFSGGWPPVASEPPFLSVERFERVKDFYKRFKPLLDVLEEIEAKRELLEDMDQKLDRLLHSLPESAAGSEKNREIGGKRRKS